MHMHTNSYCTLLDAGVLRNHVWFCWSLNLFWSNKIHEIFFDSNHCKSIAKRAREIGNAQNNITKSTHNSCNQTFNRWFAGWLQIAIIDCGKSLTFTLWDEPHRLRVLQMQNTKAFHCN